MNGNTDYLVRLAWPDTSASMSGRNQCVNSGVQCSEWQKPVCEQWGAVQ